jgi:sugar phosphate isomerase/epimerase
LRLSLSEISTVDASFAEDVEAYAEAGFEAIGLWEFKLPQDDEANRALLRSCGLGVSNCVPAVPSILQLGIPGMEGPADPEERIDALCTSMRRLAAYEPECVLVLSGPLAGREPADAREIVSGGLVRVAAAARDAGVRLGFEPIHPADFETTAFVNTIADALAILDEAGLRDVGIMADTYNLWDDAAAVRWLAANPGRVTGLHVAGWPGDGAGRALPGEAGGRERELVEALRGAGWDGSVDVEIFSTPDGFWSLPAGEAARRAYSAARSLMAP